MSYGLEILMEILMDIFTLIGGVFVVNWYQHLESNKLMIIIFLKLEKALDKACEIMTDRVNIDSGNGKPTIGFTEKEWKEWLMNNETV